MLDGDARRALGEQTEAVALVDAVSRSRELRRTVVRADTNGIAIRIEASLEVLPFAIEADKSTRFEAGGSIRHGRATRQNCRRADGQEEHELHADHPYRSEWIQDAERIHDP